MSILGGRRAVDVLRRLAKGKNKRKELTIAEARDDEINVGMPGPLDEGQVKIVRGYGRERLTDAANIAGEASEEKTGS